MRSAKSLLMAFAAVVFFAAGFTLGTSGSQEVDAGSLNLRASEGRVFLDGEPFTGYAISHHENGLLASRISYRDGKKHGKTERWSTTGLRSAEVSYKANRRDGIVRTWWADGRLRSESNFVDGVAQGSQKQWYRSGAPFKELNLVDGHEEGLQRAWRENGELYANYEARDGRIFGLKRAKLCFELDEERIQLAN